MKPVRWLMPVWKTVPASTPLCRRSLRRRALPVVALVDVSGSMSRYTRMFLHFLHAMARDCERDFFMSTEEATASGQYAVL